ncbi:phosphotransferase [Streptomyces sp. MS2.AVA.5]|uniref:Phosphotransferase n=1 Tax=Streptomyces achmelvichensis TaxID=3134111 RepID=A0ACC6Q8P0_9ACTN
MRFDEENMSTASHQPATKPVAAPSTPGPTAEEEQITAVAGTLVLAYGLHPADITRIPEGTATDNYAIVDQTGQRHFAKVYRTREHLDLERAAVELSKYAADGGIATALAIRTREHELIETHGRLPMSLWSYVPHTETAEGNLTGARWAAVGTAMGHLHSRLAAHPRRRTHPGTWCRGVRRGAGQQCGELAQPDTPISPWSTGTPTRRRPRTTSCPRFVSAVQPCSARPCRRRYQWNDRTSSTPHLRPTGGCATRQL